MAMQLSKKGVKTLEKEVKKVLIIEGEIGIEVTQRTKNRIL